MRDLCGIRVSMRHCIGDVKVRLWSRGDPFPDMGKSAGVDTETELITETCLFPKVVVLGCFDAENMVCYVVYWEDIPDFMAQLCRRNIEQRYFNLGFDEGVLDNEFPDDKPLLGAIDQGLVTDMQIRLQLHDLATCGFIRYNTASLAGATLHYLNCRLDKGDGTEDSARLSFRRFNDDGTRREITEEQARYLPLDCITTWALGEAVQRQGAEDQHVKGMVVLAHITANGFAVDPRVFDRLVEMLKSDMDEFRRQLVDLYGFPDPYRDDQAEAARLANGFWRAICDMDHGIFPWTTQEGENPVRFPCKAALKLLLAYMYDGQSPDDVDELPGYLRQVAEERTSIRKPEQAVFDAMLEDHPEMQPYVDARKAVVLPAVVSVMLRAYAEQLRSGRARERGFSFGEALSEAVDYMAGRQYWLVEQGEDIGADKFFQRHVLDLLLSQSAKGRRETERAVEELRQNPDATQADIVSLIMEDSRLKLETTPKSGAIKLTLKDMWRLRDVGVTDKFLDAYTGFNHCQKLLSTYMNPKFVKADGKVHPRFQNLVRTGRTSATGPNV